MFGAVFYDLLLVIGWYGLILGYLYMDLFDSRRLEEKQFYMDIVMILIVIVPMLAIFIY